MGYGLWEWMLGMGSYVKGIWRTSLGRDCIFFSRYVEKFIIYRNGFLLKLFWIWGLSVFSFYLKCFERDLDVFWGIWTFFEGFWVIFGGFGRFLGDFGRFLGGFSGTMWVFLGQIWYFGLGPANIYYFS